MIGETLPQPDPEPKPKPPQDDQAPADAPAPETGGRQGPDPTRYGDWEKGGRCIDF